jgi:hypothetical protein
MCPYAAVIFIPFWIKEREYTYLAESMIDVVSAGIVIFTDPSSNDSISHVAGYMVDVL